MKDFPSIGEIFAVLDATWPAVTTQEVGGFLVREGRGGGKRVSAATSIARAKVCDIEAAEVAMRDLGQSHLFQLRDDEVELDGALSDRGYGIVDPVTIYAAPASMLCTTPPPRTAAIPAWEPLEIMREIWAEGGVGPARIEVMHRAECPKTGFISRWNDKPAGSSFLSLHNKIGMVHALEILPFQRRQGVARFLMQRAAIWVRQHGGTHLAVVCTTANTGANALYTSLGMSVVGTYHYRQNIGGKIDNE